MLNKMKSITHKPAPVIIDQNQVAGPIDALLCTNMSGLDFPDKKTSNSMPLILGVCSVGQHSK